MGFRDLEAMIAVGSARDHLTHAHIDQTGPLNFRLVIDGIREVADGQTVATGYRKVLQISPTMMYSLAMEMLRHLNPAVVESETGMSNCATCRNTRKIRVPDDASIDGYYEALCPDCRVVEATIEPLWAWDDPRWDDVDPEPEPDKLRYSGPHSDKLREMAYYVVHQHGGVPHSEYGRHLLVDQLLRCARLSIGSEPALNDAYGLIDEAVDRHKTENSMI